MNRNKRRDRHPCVGSPLKWDPTHPGESLREDVLPALRMTVSQAARELAISRQLLHRIRRLLERCLNRDVAMRLQAIGEARIVLGATDEPAGPVRADVPRQPLRSAIRRAVLCGAAALVAAAAIAAGWWLARAGVPAPVVTRLSVTLPVPLSQNHETAHVALSRDGRTLAYVGVHNGTSGLYVRALDQHDVRLVAGTVAASGGVAEVLMRSTPAGGRSRSPRCCRCTFAN